MIGAEPRIEIPQMEKAADQKTRTYEEHERNGNLGDDKQTAEPRSLAPAGRITATFLERFVEAEVRCLRGWREAEDQPREHGHQGGEGQHLAVDPDRFRLRNRFRDK